MAFVTKNYPLAGALGSVERAAAELANAVAIYQMSHIYVSGLVATATTTSKVKTVTNTITYTVGGAWQTTLAPTDNFWTLSGAVVPASSWQKYALLLDTSQAASVQEATSSVVSAAAVSWANVTGVSPWAPFISMVGSTKVVVGVLTVATDSTHTFTPGTTGLGAAGITATYVNGIDQSVLPLLGTGASLVIGNGG